MNFMHIQYQGLYELNKKITPPHCSTHTKKHLTTLLPRTKQEAAFPTSSPQSIFNRG